MASRLESSEEGHQYEHGFPKKLLIHNAERGEKSISHWLKLVFVSGAIKGLHWLL